MLEVQLPTSMLSTVSSDHYYPYLPAPAVTSTNPIYMSVEEGRRKEREQMTYGQNITNQKYVSQWLEASTTANGQGPPTPPREMSAANVNPMLAPTYGGLYNSVPAVKVNASQYQTDLSNYARKKLEQPNNAATSQPQGLTQPKDTTWPNELTTRKRSSSNGSQIVSYLQIPATINDSKGSLAEFAAQVINPKSVIWQTCLTFYR